MGVNNPQRRPVLKRLKTSFERQRLDEIAPVPGLGGSGATHPVSATLDAAVAFAAGAGQPILATHVLIDPEDLYHTDTGAYDVLEAGFYAMSLMLELSDGVAGTAAWVPPGSTEGALETFEAGDTDLNVGGVLYIDAPGALIPQLAIATPGSIRVRQLAVVQLLAVFQDPSTLPPPPGGGGGDPLETWTGGNHAPQTVFSSEWDTVPFDYSDPSDFVYYTSGPDANKLVPQTAGEYNLEWIVSVEGGTAGPPPGTTISFRISGHVSGEVSAVVDGDGNFNLDASLRATASGHFNGTTDFVQFEINADTGGNVSGGAYAYLMSTP